MHHEAEAQIPSLPKPPGHLPEPSPRSGYSVLPSEKLTKALHASLPSEALDVFCESTDRATRQEGGGGRNCPWLGLISGPQELKLKSAPLPTCVNFCISSLVNGVMLVPAYLDTEKTKQSKAYRVLCAILGI